MANDENQNIVWIIVNAKPITTDIIKRL